MEAHGYERFCGSGVLRREPIFKSVPKQMATSAGRYPQKIRTLMIFAIVAMRINENTASGNNHTIVRIQLLEMSDV